MVNPTQYRCSRCGALKNANELNGLDLITGDVSHAFCIRLAECQSAEADDIMNELCDALEASDDTEQVEEQAPTKPEPVTDPVLTALDRLDAYERALDDSCPEYLHLLARVEQLANVGGCLCVMFNGHGERVQARQQSIRAAALACAQEQYGVYPVVVSGANLPDGEALLRRLVVAMGLLVHPHFQALEQLEFLQTRLEDSAGILLIVERAQCLNSHHLRALKGLYQLRSQGNRLVKILLIGEHDGLNGLTTGLKDSGLYDHTEVCHYDGQYRLENWGQALGYDDRAAPVSLQGQTRQEYNRALFKVLAKHTNEEESKVFSKTLEAFCAQMLVRRFNPGLNDASYHVYSKFCQAAK